MDRWAAFFGLAAAGQIFVWLVSQFIIRRILRRLRPLHKIDEFDYTDLLVTVPALAWAMQ